MGKIITFDDVVNAVNNVLREVLGVDEIEEQHWDEALSGDFFGCDDSALTEVELGIEDLDDIHISDSEHDKMKTPRDLYELVAQKLGIEQN